MALSFSVVREHRRLNEFGVRSGLVDITLDGNYVAGGFVLDPDAIAALRYLDNLQPPAAKAGYVFEFVPGTTPKLKAYKEAGAAGVLAECAVSEAGLNGLVLRCYYEGS